MATYSLSSRNQLRSPSGAVGEPPDGPGGMAALRDDVDNILGVGGAEYCANAAAMSAIPASRKFIGKLAYRADLDIVFRYVGPNGSTTGGANTWTAWSKPAANFTPVYGGGLSGGTFSTNRGVWGIAEGLIWVSTWSQYSAAPTFGTAEVTLAIPERATAQYGEGMSMYSLGGSSSANSQHLLMAYPAGTPDTSIMTLRIRPVFANAAGATAKVNPGFTQLGTPTATDWINVNFRGPCALTG